MSYAPNSMSLYSGTHVYDNSDDLMEATVNTGLDVNADFALANNSFDDSDDDDQLLDEIREILERDDPEFNRRLREQQLQAELELLWELEHDAPSEHSESM